MQTRHDLREEVDNYEHLKIPEDYGGSVRILFVEDSDEDMELVQESLYAAHIFNRPAHAHTAERAWEILTESTSKLPDWIFIDRTLPGSMMTGDELIEKICKDERFLNCRVIVLSGGELTEHEKNRFTDLGVNVFFPKPLTARNILDMVGASANLWMDIFKRRHVA